MACIPEELATTIVIRVESMDTSPENNHWSPSLTATRIESIVDRSYSKAEWNPIST